MGQSEPDRDNDEPTAEAMPIEPILVVDDTDDIRELFTVALEGAGFPVIVARNGQEALGLADAHRPSIILLDIAMPVMDGIATIQALKENARTAGIPVMAVSAHELVVAELRRLGFAGVVPKPVSPATLVAAVRLCLDRGGQEWVEVRRIDASSHGWLN